MKVKEGVNIDTITVGSDSEVTLISEKGTKIKLTGRQIDLLWDLIGNGRMPEILFNLLNGFANICTYKIAYDQENDNLVMDKEFVIDYTLLMNFFKFWIQEGGKDEEEE